VRSSIMPDSADGHGGRTFGRGTGHAAWAARLGRLVPRLLLIVAVALLASAIALFVFRAAYADKVYPAVAVGDVYVGGMTADQAASTVEQRAAQLEQGTISFTWNGMTWTPTLSEIGATIDVESSVDAAWALGRDDNAVARLGFTNQLLRGDQLVPLRTTIDRDALHRWFEAVNADIGHPAVDASLEVEGTNVTVTPEQVGTIVDEDAATALILESLRTLEPVATELPTTNQNPNIYAADLEPHKADIAAALDGPIVATFDGQKWDIPASDLVQFLTVDVAWRDGGTAVEMNLDREALASYLRDGFAGQVNRSPVDAQVAWSTDQGGLVAIEPSTDGAALRASSFADLVAESFLGDQSAVEIPVLVTKPAVDSNNLAALGIDGLLARGDSNYDGGKPERDKNIEVGTDLLNGELIAPGEEFSFNGAVGEITAEKGFVEAGVIEAETIGRDVGGGICQVSTTTFRAALLAGAPMTEWWPHSLRLKGYERDGWTAGFDASILQSGSNPEYWGDFRFLNDTDGYMLVQAWNDYPYNIVEIYGNDDGRTVEIGEPSFKTPDWKYEDKEVVDLDEPAGTMKQTQWPTEPYEVVYTRRVTYADGQVAEREFYSGYQGSGNVWVVSPDMQGKSPISNPTPTPTPAT
jgi:vancomycin resistance protein YoaR